MPYSDPNVQREFQRLWMQARREDWIEAQGGTCAKCNSTERLEVDHLDPSTKSMNPRNIWGRREEDRLAELAKCQVLCYTCHKDKSSVDKGRLDHGLTAYKKGRCKCDEICRPAQAKSRREYRARQRARLMEQQT